MTRSDAARQPSFVRSLLEGKVDVSAFSPYPHLSYGRLQQAEDMLARIRTDHETRSGIDHLREWGILGPQAAWPTPLLARLIRQVGATDVSAALCATVHLALGVKLIQRFGREDQLRSVLDNPRALCAFSLTEESPGSDVGRIQTFAEAADDGYLLSGTKHWVTNARWATHFVVVARTAPPVAADKPRLTAFLVRKGPGVTIEQVATDVLPGAGVARVKFDQVRLERRDILGTVGKGFRVVMSGLSEARLLVSAAMLGSSIGAYNDIVERLKARRAFGRPVGNFPSVQAKVAGMLSEILAMESLVHAVAGVAEAGAPADPVERGVMRLAASRGANRVLEGARELYGAAAFAGDNSVSRKWADTRALSLLDGSDHALESFVILEGTRDLRHRFAQMADSADPLGRVDAAASLLLRKVGARMKRATAEQVPGLSLDLLHEYTGRLSHEVDAAIRRHGSEIVEKQHLHRRLAALVAELATWVTLVSRVQSEIERAGEVGARRMIDVASVWVLSAKERILDLFTEMDDNDDSLRDEIAVRAYNDGAYPFEVFGD